MGTLVAFEDVKTVRMASTGYFSAHQFWVQTEVPGTEKSRSSR